MDKEDVLIRNKDELIRNGGKEFFRERKLLLDALEKGLKEVSPEKVILRSVRISNSILKIKGKEYNLKDFKDTYILSFGKASIKMAETILSLLDVKEGIVVGDVNYHFLDERIRYIKGSHPIPDEGSLKAGEEILSFLERVGEEDLLIVLLSGGGSSLVESSLVPLNDLRKITELLILSGASIEEINVVRKHLSLIKGGGIVKRCRGRVVSLIISDVPFDSIEVIASGPTTSDSSTFKDAMSILSRYRLFEKIPESVREIILKGLRGEIDETLKDSDEKTRKVDNFIVASNYDLCTKVKEYLEKSCIRTAYLTSNIQGEAREIAKTLGGLIYDTFYRRNDFEKPIVFILGGETTVSVKGKGMGGKNQELSLAISPYLTKVKGVFLSFGTDGIDGNSLSGGAICDSKSIMRAQKLNLNYRDFLKNNDSHAFFSKLRDTVITGRTGTNVMDVMLLFVK